MGRGIVGYMILKRHVAGLRLRVVSHAGTLYSCMMASQWLVTGTVQNSRDRPPSGGFFVYINTTIMKLKYKTVDITTEKGIREAEALKSKGWIIISSSPFTVIFERPA